MALSNTVMISMISVTSHFWWCIVFWFLLFFFPPPAWDSCMNSQSSVTSGQPYLFVFMASFPFNFQKVDYIQLFTDMLIVDYLPLYLVIIPVDGM